MNCLFMTQGASLRLFHGLSRQLTGGGRSGFVVADSWHYRHWLQENPGFETEGYAVLKEWEVTNDRGRPFDPANVRAQCERLGAPDLFNAIIADRRLIMGLRATYVQDYRRRFDDRTLFSILGAGIEAMETLFDTVRPDVVIGFICTTFLDYLGDTIARARGIPSLNVRTTRIGNRVSVSTTLTDPSPELCAAFKDANAHGSPHVAAACEHISRIRAGDARYEGVIALSSKPAEAITSHRSPVTRAVRFARNLAAYRSGPYAGDNHTPGLLRPLLYQTVLNPLRARRAEALLSPGYVTPDSLRGQRFAFLPLHTEPEVSQLVYARPLVNQIELARMIAYSLPADMVLVLKEHPWMVGKRSLGAYAKFLDIPRVRFASPSLTARTLVQRADIVTVLTSSVGIEAVILGKPVLSFGHAPFNLLPNHMVRRGADLLVLPDTIVELLAAARTDEPALQAYVAAVLATSVTANLYSVLLGRTNVHSVGAQDFEADIDSLAALVRKRIADSKLVVSAPRPALAGT